ncbi:hypothetical protein SCT_3014 [Sulfuricella sp. T08]|uniref:hypothetical protein n=1 Tax=Sulfuricella sp. T08 TaxID=1632857 RepID=UPI000617A113|nr:hypothetical protein [Sulfuricella sp. T08]GAO37579.1 hypothetical protein SCT_3014 [Sulfuricella sp. T08]
MDIPNNEDFSAAVPSDIRLIVREGDVTSIANYAARRAETKIKQDAGMTLTRARRLSCDAKGTDEIKSVVRTMLARGSTKEQALLAVNAAFHNL